ncbi:hypothetical protein EVAR_74595_1 [Eumeta japonica]|uniref:Uncharacterized protein n=1 Tax=Eumeta variegata TaxID=151549 RepID=A0A4C1WB21_EUMVA|nr:hypothetical protein EVAR_74595_1 [Eumeta japonica]
MNTARQKKRAALLAQLEFEQLESERMLRARRAYKMLLLRLEADEEDSGDLIDCDNASHYPKRINLRNGPLRWATLSPCPNRVRRQRHHRHRRHAAKLIVHPLVRRPDAIIKQELNKLRRMTPMNGGMGNISSFANKVNNCVAAIRTLNKLSYLSAPNDR